MKMTIAILFFMLPLLGIAQGNSDALTKVEAAKIGLISERLGLTPDQAEKFWPIYREYSDRRKSIQSQMREARKGFDPKTASDEETQKLINLGHELKQRNLDLQKEYSDRLLKVINNRQLLSLRKAEEDFRKIILQKLEQRRRQQSNQEQYRHRNNERLKNKRN